MFQKLSIFAYESAFRASASVSHMTDRQCRKPLVLMSPSNMSWHLLDASDLSWLSSDSDLSHSLIAWLLSSLRPATFSVQSMRFIRSFWGPGGRGAPPAAGAGGGGGGGGRG